MPSTLENTKFKQVNSTSFIILLRRLNIDVFTCLNFHLPRWSTLCYGPCLTDVHWTSSTINRCSTRYSSIFRLADRNLFCVKFVRYLTALVISFYIVSLMITNADNGKMRERKNYTIVLHQRTNFQNACPDWLP